MSNKSQPAFFTGYLPMPAALKKFYWPLAIVLVACSALAGFLIAHSQKSVPAAIWNTAQATTMTGVITVSPYPALHRASAQDPNKVESILIVMQGKHSADHISAGFDGSAVSISGFLIERGGWTMLEITGEDAIEPTTQAPDTTILASIASHVPLGEVTLSGEIVDSKCFLGVMKPGDGTVHKACAEMCLLGHLPPMLAVEGTNDSQYGYLLVHSDGSSATDSLAKLVAESVEVSGQMVRHGDLVYLHMNDTPPSLL